ncbi:hypothetical protein [Pseudoalteromonas sp. S1612]|uniref:hypothetical protein n=1 Tax=Pseudoalteromonas sp. S1612 TaxID=579507 RepID=UPI00110ADC5C|nr:hypothetical protein [Pseudoalteromonas sp. S1612]TMP55074.1 hypothetical protein CWB78_09575 [Pseudoalteromonas sp. S1612]
MNKFFTSTGSLSAHSKWILIRLITEKMIGDELSKSDLIGLGCTHNKFKKVIDELQEINAILKHKTEHSKKGRPAESYIFIYDEHTEMTKSLPSKELVRIKNKKLKDEELRVPVKIVWCFFVLNQDEFGYVVNFTLSNIAKACRLKDAEVKTAISQLIDLKLIQKAIKGCTLKKVEVKNKRNVVETEDNNFKRSSCFKIIGNNHNKFIYLFTFPSLTNLESHANRKKIYNLSGALIDFFFSEKKRENVFLGLLRFEVDSLEHDSNFLCQQPKEVFSYFDGVLLKLVSMGLSYLLNGGTNIKPVSQKDAFSHIFSPADYEVSAANLGHGTSYLIRNLANIYIHYILYSIVHSLKDTPKVGEDIEKYLSSIHSLKKKDNCINAFIENTHSKVEFNDVTSIYNLILFTNLDLCEKVKSNDGTVTFMDSKSQLKNGNYNIFHIDPKVFEAFYKDTLTSEQN